MDFPPIRRTTVPDIPDLPKRISVRNITTPNEARWNSIEVFEYYSTGALAFDLLRPVVSDFYLGYWHNEDSVSVYLDPDS